MFDVLSIGVVARVTGVSTDTIRAWERRYGLVSPARNKAGIRTYVRSDVDRIALARAATGLGHSIGRIAECSNEQLQQLLGSEVPAGRTPGASAEAVARTFDALLRYEIQAAESILRSAMLLAPFDELFRGILLPLVRKIAETWGQGRLLVGQEHLVSCLVRNLVGSCGAATRNARSTTRMVFATPPGELHEFGIRVAACLAAARNVHTYVLGPNVPADEIISAVRQTDANIVVVGCTLDGAPSETQAYLQALERGLPTRTRLWIGGRGASPSLIRDSSSRTRCMSSLIDFVQQLPTDQTSTAAAFVQDGVTRQYDAGKGAYFTSQ
ncbi:MAG: MerR family transcriptional regulator [Candidatus Eremiobacteraeota bacterium]|nr:MerR family transcriptional regulator [Candidatus Eremiobacteraeota bacterium]